MVPNSLCATCTVLAVVNLLLKMAPQPATIGAAKDVQDKPVSPLSSPFTERVAEDVEPERTAAEIEKQLMFKLEAYFGRFSST